MGRPVALELRQLSPLGRRACADADGEQAKSSGLPLRRQRDLAPPDWTLDEPGRKWHEAGRRLVQCIAAVNFTAHRIKEQRPQSRFCRNRADTVRAGAAHCPLLEAPMMRRWLAEI